MRFAVGLLVAFVCSGALASPPGQPLDCSDWVFDEPGHSCVQVIPYDCRDNPACFKGTNSQVDNQGRLLWTRQIGVSTGGGAHSEIQVVATNMTNGTDTVIARLADRCALPDYCDMASLSPFWGYCAISTSCDGVRSSGGGLAHPLAFDPNSGRLLMPIMVTCGLSCGGCCPGYLPGGDGHQTALIAISGFTTTFDVFQSFAPKTILGFRVPHMPEGMAGADHFDTYWGALTKPIDFTQAHPLACNYPATPPHVGDYLSVPDTVPTPMPGQGVYYVTSATHQGATRYGRKTTAGQLSGRDPVLLPSCAATASIQTEVP